MLNLLLFCVFIDIWYFRSGVEEPYAEKKHLLYELIQVHDAEENKKETSTAARKKQAEDIELAKEMREASLHRQEAQNDHMVSVTPLPHTIPRNVFYVYKLMPAHACHLQYICLYVIFPWKIIYKVAITVLHVSSILFIPCALDPEGEKPEKRTRLNVAEEIRKRTDLKAKELELRERELKLAKNKEAREGEERKEEREERRQLIKYLIENNK